MPLPEAGIRVVSRSASALGESPVWHAASASLLWVDIPARSLHCIQPDSGVQRSWRLPEEPGCIGLVAGDEGPVPAKVVMALRSGFHLFDLNGQGMLVRLSPPLFDTTRYRFNDGGVDPAGRFWAGSMDERKTEANAGLYCLERGRARAVTGRDAGAGPWRDWGVRTSNGLAFSPDGRTLYHSDTPAHVVYAYDYDLRTGTIERRRVWWQADADRNAADYGGRPDGAAVDVEGCYWTAQYEGGRILKLSPGGELLQVHPVPARCPTMVAFGGPDLSTLFVTSARQGRNPDELARFPGSGHVFAMAVDVPGLPANAYRE